MGGRAGFGIREEGGSLGLGGGRKVYGERRLKMVPSERTRILVARKKRKARWGGVGTRGVYWFAGLGGRFESDGP